MRATLLISLFCVMCQGSLTEKLEAVVIQHPSWPQVFIGEKITLKCAVLEGQPEDWWYEWQHNDSPMATPVEMQDIIFQHVEFHDHGTYKCIGSRKTRHEHKAESETYHMSVLDLPKVTLTVVFPTPPFSSGDEVTLRCDIKAQEEGWAYHWNRNFRRLTDKTSKSIVVTVPDENGQYSCSIHREHAPYLKSISDNIDIFARGLMRDRIVLGLFSVILLILVVGLLYVICKDRGHFKWPPQLVVKGKGTDQDQDPYEKDVEGPNTYESIPLTEPISADASVPGLQTVYTLLEPDNETRKHLQPDLALAK